MELQKYSGAGNKFIIIDNLPGKIENPGEIVLSLMSEEDNKEMDGVIFLETSGKADYKMNYFNRDGTGDALCGNGLRCTAMYIKDNGISTESELMLDAVGETYRCILRSDGRVSVSFPSPVKIKTNFKLKVNFSEWWELLNCSYVDCGSPHIVVFIDEIEKPKVNSLEEVKINEWGRNIRMHKDLLPEGANVNFVQVKDLEGSEIEIRSFERGVEAETLACGTGAVSSAIISFGLRDIEPPVKVLTRSGEHLTVDFDFNNNKVENLTLTGSAVRI